MGSVLQHGQQLLLDGGIETGGGLHAVATNLQGRGIPCPPAATSRPGDVGRPEQVVAMTIIGPT